LFSINRGSSLFFVALTLAADLLCINLIVATGTRQYKIYANSILQKRLIDRKHALLTLYYAFAHLNVDKPGMLMKKDWLYICDAISNSSDAITRSTAEMIFDMEDVNHSHNVDEFQFFRMCAMVSLRVNITAYASKTDVDDNTSSSSSKLSNPLESSEDSTPSDREVTTIPHP